MTEPRTGATTPDAFDNPLYRVGHLHGTEWVTLQPAAQHSPREHDPSGDWAGAQLYVCPTCEERVMVRGPMA